MPREERVSLSLFLCIVYSHLPRRVTSFSNCVSERRSSALCEEQHSVLFAKLYGGPCPMRHPPTTDSSREFGIKIFWKFNEQSFLANFYKREIFSWLNQFSVKRKIVKKRDSSICLRSKNPVFVIQNKIQGISIRLVTQRRKRLIESERNKFYKRFFFRPLSDIFSDVFTYSVIWSHCY